jgi:thioredoxin reductase
MPHPSTNGTKDGKTYADAIKSGPGSESESESDKQEGEEEEYEGPVIHSSELDETDLEGKTVLVVGSGASGVEAVETALSKGAKKAIMIARLFEVFYFRVACL